MVAISALPIGQTVYSPAVALTSSVAQIAWDLHSAQNAKYLALENSTLMNPSNMEDGLYAQFLFIQNDTSAKTLAFDSAYQPSNNLPLITTALNSVCLIQFYCDGTHMIIERFSQNLVV